MNTQSARIKLIKRLKSLAKAQHKQHSALQLSHFQNLIAGALHYLNWSLLHQDIHKMTADRFEELHDQAHVIFFASTSSAAQTAAPFSNTPEARQEARDIMEEHVRSSLSPLINFAPYDSEAENGFAFPEVEIDNYLMEAFEGEYPDDLIEEVARELELDEGPWGDEELYNGSESTDFEYLGERGETNEADAILQDSVDGNEMLFGDTDYEDKL